jgi:phospholipid/cholesterol/gamma-HCH transport system permease protein
MATQTKVDSAAAGAPPLWEVTADPATGGAVRLRLSGAWRLQAALPSASDVHARLASQGARRLVFDTEGLAGWDSGLLSFLMRLDRLLATSDIAADPAGLPQGVQRLLRLATAVPERKGARREASAEPLLTRVGKETLDLVKSSGEVTGFLGEVTLALGRLLHGQARFRSSDLFLVMQEVGAQAMPIVSLISFLVGVILAFLGAIQLVQFGAQIYVADLVGIGMARDMAAMMVGIILAGRTGAAFAAQLGTMQVNEEIDALSTFGFSPMDFLVLPRVVALVLMTPLLCLYANLMGILGGALIGVTVLDLPLITYLQETQHGIRLIDFTGGLIKSAVYGVVVAAAGCLRGMQCGRSSAAVGQATTSAVVTSIVFIILSMAVLTVIYNALGI